jgi:hypothetical protein
VWTTTGAVNVQVFGTNFSSLELNGSAALCPGVVDAGVCTPIAGSHTFQIVARDGLGREVLRSATLVVG